MALIEVENHGRYAMLWMNKPPANGLDPSFVHDFDQALRDVEDHSDIHAIVLGSRSPSIFCAGADAKWFASILETDGPDSVPQRFLDFSNALYALLQRMANSRLIVVAALAGHTLAGGLELACACDVRFAHAAIRINAPERQVFGALPTGGGGLQYLVNLVGPQRAFRMVATGNAISGEQAHSWGLIDILSAEGQVNDDAQHFVEMITSQAHPESLADAKRAILCSLSGEMALRLAKEREMFIDEVHRPAFTYGAQEFVNQFGRKTS